MPQRLLAAGASPPPSCSGGGSSWPSPRTLPHSPKRPHCFFDKSNTAIYAYLTSIGVEFSRDHLHWTTSAVQLHCNNVVKRILYRFVAYCYYCVSAYKFNWRRGGAADFKVGVQNRIR